VNRIGDSLAYLPFSSSFKHQAINKLPVNDINPPLPPSPPPSLLLRPLLNPPPAPHKRYHKSPCCIPAPTQHPHLNSPFPPLWHKHNRRRHAKILPHLGPLDRHHPKSNLNIRLRVVQKSTENFHISPDSKFIALAASRGLVNILNTRTY